MDLPVALASEGKPAVTWTGWHGVEILVASVVLDLDTGSLPHLTTATVSANSRRDGSLGVT